MALFYSLYLLFSIFFRRDCVNDYFTLGPLKCQEGVLGLSKKKKKKNTLKGSFFHNRALFVRKANWVSNSCNQVHVKLV